MKLININGTYINPDTVVCVEDINNQYEGQFIRVTTNAGPVGDEDNLQAHTIEFGNETIEDVVSVLTGKATKMPAKKKNTELADKMNSVLEAL